jgi:hypothetical protein
MIILQYQIYFVNTFLKFFYNNSYSKK